MDTLLSPRRRTVLQALAAAALVTACGDRRTAAAVPMIEFRGPTMGTSYTAKIAGSALTEARTAASRRGRCRRARRCRREDVDVPSRFRAVTIQSACRRRAVLGFRRPARCILAGAEGERRIGRCIRRHGRAHRRCVGVRAGEGPPRGHRSRKARAGNTRRLADALCRRRSRNDHQATRRHPCRSVRHREGIWRRSGRARARGAGHRRLHDRGRRRSPHARPQC